MQGVLICLLLPLVPSEHLWYHQSWGVVAMGAEMLPIVALYHLQPKQGDLLSLHDDCEMFNV